MSQRAWPALTWRLCASLALLPPLLALAACEGRDAPAGSAQAPSASSAAAQPTAASSAASPPGSDASAAMPKDFDTRFAELHRTVHAEGTFFSGSEMSAKLAVLEPAADTAERRFQLHALQADVFGRRSMGAEAAERAQLALNIAQAWPPEQQAAERLFLRINQPKWLQDEDDAQALAKLQPLLAEFPLNQLDSLPLTAKAESTTPSALTVLGLHQQHGHLLHELERYPEALSANLQTLAAARERLPPDEQHRLQGVLTNIAQNHHALGQLKEAEPYLLERLKLVQAQGDDERVLDTYFQLMVLAHERGLPKQADAWLARHEAHTKAMDDEDAIAESKDLRRELLQRRATGR